MIWRIAMVVLLLVVAPAHAATYSFADQGEAYSACQAAAASARSFSLGTPPNDQGFLDFASPGMQCTITGVGSTKTSLGCAFRVKWNRDGSYASSSRACQTQANGSTDFYEYPNVSNCTARNQTLGVGPRVYVGAAPSCVAGCRMSHGAMTAVTEGGVKEFYTTTTQYTGETCQPELPPKGRQKAPTAADDKQSCTPLGNGQTACRKSTGEYCATGANGGQHCWKPMNQTGERVSGDELQRRTDGPVPPVKIDKPATPAPEGKEWQRTSSHTTTINNQSITTTNYKAVPVGTPDPENPTPHKNSQGGDGPEAEGGEGEGDKNGVGGDGSCAAGWAPSGDPVLGGILTESWKQRCADEKVQSDMRADAQTLADANGDDPSADGVWSDGGDAGSINEGWLIFGAGSCPVISIPLPSGAVFTPPPAFCSVIAGLAALFQLAAYLWALRIVSD